MSLWVVRFRGSGGHASGTTVEPRMARSRVRSLEGLAARGQTSHGIRAALHPR